MLWLALFFPRLSLEAQSERTPSRQTAAGAFVVEQGLVCVVDDAAHAAGVRPGMRLSTARGLLPEGRIVERDAPAIAREVQAIDALACFCGNFSAIVCRAGPAALTLEVGASQRLFGGVSAMLARLRLGCQERGFSVQSAVAPTPRAAEWLALADAGGEPACCLTGEALPDMLARLPLAVLDAAPDAMGRLRAFGMRRIGDLIAQPRAALARRIGHRPVEHLQQALGELPDPRAPLVFPEVFRLAVELPAPAANAEMIGFPARRLIADLCGWLAIRQSGTRACTLRLLPERRGLAAQIIELRLAADSRDPARFSRLLRERLERTVLLAPIGEMILEALVIVPLAGYTPGLLDARPAGESLDALLERLRGRLGHELVHGLRVQPDHRPECATRNAAVGFADPATSAVPAARRPLMLFDPPLALTEIDGRPARGGEVFELLSGPERIESGWWDQGETPPAPDGDASDSAGGGVPMSGRLLTGDVRRDYFLARSSQGECWWIFRDAAGWWGHGSGFATA